MNDQREEIKRKIGRLFGDMSRPASQTLRDLEWIELHIQELIQTLRDEDVESDEE